MELLFMCFFFCLYRIGVDEEIEALPEPKNRRVCFYFIFGNFTRLPSTSNAFYFFQEESPIHSQTPSDKSFLARIWGNFDVHYMKPLLTQSSPTLIETLPPCMGPIARILTTTEQLTQVCFISTIFSNSSRLHLQSLGLSLGF